MKNFPKATIIDTLCRKKQASTASSATKTTQSHIQMFMNIMNVTVPR